MTDDEKWALKFGGLPAMSWNAGIAALSLRNQLVRDPDLLRQATLHQLGTVWLLRGDAEFLRQARQVVEGNMEE